MTAPSTTSSDPLHRRIGDALRGAPPHRNGENWPSHRAKRRARRRRAKADQ